MITVIMQTYMYVFSVSLITQTP